MNTLNKLDEKFQITEKHDPDHIFPEELEYIKQLREEFPDLQFYSDKWIVYFLCARRHDLDEVRELLGKFLKMRTDYGWRTSMPDIYTDTFKAMRNDRTCHCSLTAGRAPLTPSSRICLPHARTC